MAGWVTAWPNLAGALWTHVDVPICVRGWHISWTLHWVVAWWGVSQWGSVSGVTPDEGGVRCYVPVDLKAR